MMMDFIMLTLSIAVAILLASSLSLVLVMNKKVLKWYLHYVNKITDEVVNEVLAVSEEES